ncbi:hypothetical protein DRO66_03270 [Candidatus Bathyarchaeota archaeon]|nr:MAG: hypothetical protein DRO66_03270 [Candidatus Bathyarchaeota archaeon]
MLKVQESKYLREEATENSVYAGGYILKTKIDALYFLLGNRLLYVLSMRIINTGYKHGFEFSK